MTTSATVDIAREFLAVHEIDTVRVEWCDLYGMSRGKSMSREHFLAAVESGTTFSSAALQMDLQGETHLLAGQSNAQAWVSLLAVPDVSSLHPYASQQGVARCLSDLFTTEGEPVLMSPRQVLQRVVAQGVEMGLVPSIGLELEFYLLPGAVDERAPVGRQVYRMQSSAAEHTFLEPLYRQMSEAGIEVEAICAEDGPGQFEIILQHTSALAAADAAYTARNLLKELAARQGLIATFLSRPLEQHSGSGSHIHQSLWNLEGEPLFTSGEGPAECIFWRYLAGQLRHFREASALYLPTINAYKRLALRTDPFRIEWAYEHRTAALRVLGSSTGTLRVENRAIAGEANPYLSVAAALATGFEGIRRAESLPSAFRSSDARPAPRAGAPLPRSLEDALTELSASATMRRWLGSDVVDAFILLKSVEVRRYETAVTDWELREYLTAL